MKRFLTLAVTMLLVLSMFAGIAASANAEKPEIVITIPSYFAGENVNALMFLPMVERFNQEYENRYRIVVEELVMTEYGDKIMLLAQTGKLPPLIHGNGVAVDWTRQVIIPNELFYDLKPWLDERPELLSRCIAESINFNTVDGKVVGMPFAIFTPIGLYYNETMFQPSKPIGDMSMDEFVAELGDNKIAFMTAENAWCINLFQTAIIGAMDGGQEYLRDHLIDKVMDFNNEYWIESFRILQKLLQDTMTPNTVGAFYEEAANAFMSKNAAVIANGPWMVGDFIEETGGDKWSNGFTGDQVRGAAYPGNIVCGNPYEFGWIVPSTISDDEREVALAFLEFMYRVEEIEEHLLIVGGAAPNVPLSDSFLARRAEDRLMSEYLSAMKSDTLIVSICGSSMPSSITVPEYGKLMPLLIDGTYTPEQMCQELTKKAAEFAYDD